jgi:ligand-binding sensor domain-containing protein
MTRRCFILFLSLTFAGEVAIAQVRKYAYQQLTEQQGLSQNFVYALTQDRRGFLWMGTGAGLSRYDGFEIRKFTTLDSLSSDFVTADYHTSSGNLILGHNNGGVTFFDGVRFKALLPDTLGNKVIAIAEGKAGSFWVATQSKGLIFLDEKYGRMSHHIPAELEGKIVNAMIARNNLLWVATNEGLLLYAINGNVLTLVADDVLTAYVGASSITPHHADPELTWVGTSFNGIYLVKTTPNGKAAIVNVFRSPEFSSDVIQSITQDQHGDLWVGTRNNGVVHLNLVKNGLSVFKTTFFRKTSGFPFTSVNRLIIDRQGQIWVSTMGDGVFKIYKELFAYFPMERFGVSEVRSIAETADGYLVATDEGLLQITMNPESDEYEITDAGFLSEEPILSIFTDSRQDTWIGTERKGVFVLSSKSKVPEPVLIDPETEPVEVRLFEEDTHGNIWISAKAQGVYTLSRDRIVIRHLTTANRFIHNDIFAIKADSRGNMWFGTYGAGLAMLSKESHLQLFSKDDILNARDINDIDEDGAGNIWVATEGDGFFKYANSQFTQIGSIQNLVSPFIKGMQFDPTGRIWFSYRKGLGYYDLKSEKKHHFTNKDGLLPNEAYSSSIIVDSKLNKWFCNDFGVTLFEYDTLADDRKALITYPTGMRVFFREFPADVTNTSSTGVQPLELNYDQNHVTFDFVAIKLNRTGDIYYRHFLKGYDAEWTPPERANFVTYTNLDPGKYVLQVQATDDLGAWVDPVTEFSFEITPPYWKRTWFYFLQIVSVVALFAITYFLGKKGMATKRYVVRLMLFASFFITLEYVENFIDPLVSDFFGGAPVFRFFLNFILALLLLPVETVISHWLLERRESGNHLGGGTAEVVLEDEEYGTKVE